MPLLGGLREHAPTLSLFDNAVLTSKHEPPQVPRDRYQKNKALTQALTALLPGPRELDVLLGFSENWWTIWRKMFPNIVDRRDTTMKESLLQSLRSENPAQVAKMIICIAISIHQLPTDCDFSKLRMDGSLQELTERYITTVDQLITSDDEIAGTTDGVECLYLQSKYYFNLGRPRRAWHVNRRAISFAQLLGFHRLVLTQTAKPDQQRGRQMSLWSHLFLMDGYLCLTLGLPLCIHSNFRDPCIPPLGQPTELPDALAFMLRLSPIVAKIVDRNQNPSLDFSLTLRIDQDMEELVQSTPETWWAKTDALAPCAEDQFDRQLAQFYFHSVRQLLHLPFMLKSSSDIRYQYSYTAALDSARHVIRSYDALRGPHTAGLFICKVADFQAFSAAMLILLNLYGYSDGSRAEVEQNQRDSALVDATIEILRKASQEAGGIVAAQSLKALEMIAEARHGCGDEGSPNRTHTKTVKISIPFFGVLTIGAGKKFSLPRRGTYPRQDGKRQEQQASEEACMATTAPPNIGGLPTPPSATNSKPLYASPLYLPTESSSTTSSVLPPSNANTRACPDLPLAPRHHSSTTAAITDQFRVDEPFISFDSYMAVPPIAGGGMDMDQFNGEMNMAMGMRPEMGDVGAFFPWDSGVALDLDVNWNWSGAEGVAVGGGGGGASGQDAVGGAARGGYF